jgi:hypothetical protein
MRRFCSIETIERASLLIPRSLPVARSLANSIGSARQAHSQSIAHASPATLPSSQSKEDSKTAFQQSVEDQIKLLAKPQGDAFQLRVFWEQMQASGIKPWPPLYEHALAVRRATPKSLLSVILTGSGTGTRHPPRPPIKDVDFLVAQERLAVAEPNSPCLLSRRPPARRAIRAGPRHARGAEDFGRCPPGVGL